MLRRLCYIYLLVILMITGCTTYDSFDEESNNYPPIDPTPSEEYAKLVLYFPNYELTRLSQEVRLVKMKRQNEQEAVIDELLKGPNDSQSLNLIPSGTKLLSIDVMEGTAYVNFSKDFIEKNYSEREEVLTIYSIVNSLTQLEDVINVQILINGQIKDVLHTHLSLANSKEFSSFVVNYDYVSHSNTIVEFYDSIITSDYARAMNLFTNDKKETYKKGILSPYFDEIYSNTDEIIVTDYIINEYGRGANGRTNLWVNVVMYNGSFGRTEKFEEYDLIYQNGKFRISEVEEDTDER
ncbi:MAG: GerMN domain-containing protein [Firmicutes bacterium]|nr:GerMN domain-containing protein [Bacillota bacterium]